MAPSLGRLSRAAGGSFTLGAVGGVQVHHLELGEVAAAPSLLPYHSHLQGRRSMRTGGKEDKQVPVPPAGLPVQHSLSRNRWAPWLGRLAKWDGVRGGGVHLAHLPGEAELQKQGSARSQRVLSGTPEGHHLHRKAREILIFVLRRISR